MPPLPRLLDTAEQNPVRKTRKRTPLAIAKEKQARADRAEQREREQKVPRWLRLEPPKFFEYGELPLWILVLLRERGPRKRLFLEQGSFGASPTILHKGRVQAALQYLIARGLVEKGGFRRSYVYRLSDTGKKHIAGIASPKVR